MLDTEGYVSEASGENIFFVKKNQVFTPPTTSALQGLTRDAVFKILKAEGFSVMEKFSSRDELYIADEIFLTGTAAEITPIRELDNRVIGGGKPGPITKKVQSEFFKIVKGESKQYAEWLSYL
jgi:branched-chain amino acid aminotransferase